MKVLVADNRADSKEILGGILNREGHEFSFVEDGGEVINKVYILLPDIIMLGLNFSKPSGLDILEKLKSAPSTRDIPVILIGTGRNRGKLANGYALGAYDYISFPFFREEVTARLRNITHGTERVKELETLLDRDYLTGLYNRRFFMERLSEEFAWAVRYRDPLSLFLMDIDHFKKINDTYGHGCGDVVLKQLAAVLTNVLRTEDVVARYGGEEFITLLPNTPSEVALVLAERLRASVQNSEFSCDRGDRRLSVTVSVGVNTFDGSSDLLAESFIGQADVALYAAKSDGRNKVMSHV